MEEPDVKKDKKSENRSRHKSVDNKRNQRLERSESKEKKDKTLDPMDPASYSDIPRYGFFLLIFCKYVPA